MSAPPGSRRALLVAGATASGKSAIALALAERLGGTVINADAMQVYADLAVLTARPGPKATVRAPHVLYGTVDAGDPYSVSRWLDDVRTALIEAAGVPIVVGGTGLYLRALVQGLSPIPAVPEAVRAAVRGWAEGRPPAELHARLAREDPATAARLRPTDPQRITRALEVHAATGGSLVGFQQLRGEPLLHSGKWRGVTLVVERAALRARLDARFDAMMATGALAEVERLAARTLDPGFPAMRALGVPPLLRALHGDLSLADAVAEAKGDTKRFAKRQDTFFRHQLPSFAPMAPVAALDALLRAGERDQR